MSHQHKRLFLIGLFERDGGVSPTRPSDERMTNIAGWIARRFVWLRWLRGPHAPAQVLQGPGQHVRSLPVLTPPGASFPRPTGTGLETGRQDGRCASPRSECSRAVGAGRAAATRPSTPTPDRDYRWARHTESAVACVSGLAQSPPAASRHPTAPPADGRVAVRGQPARVAYARTARRPLHCATRPASVPAHSRAPCTEGGDSDPETRIRFGHCGNRQARAAEAGTGSGRPG